MTEEYLLLPIKFVQKKLMIFLQWVALDA